MPQAELLQKVLDRANIGDWDLLLIGDGSGTGWEDACGWASILIDKSNRARKTFYGGMNFGSVNLAEMMPYFQSMVWYHHSHGKARLKQKCPLLVHVITDSQVTALHGNRAASGHEDLAKVGHRALWAAMREFAALGYRFEWHWAGRCDSGLNYLADLIAGLSRREIKHVGIDLTGVDGVLAVRGANAIQRVTFADPETGEVISPYSINPDGESTHESRTTGQNQ